MGAQIYPRDWEHSLTPPHPKEIEFGQFLVDELDEDWIIFPNFHWVRPALDKGSSFGEIDFLILSPCGLLHCIELKDNPKLFSDNGSLWAQYSKGKPTNVLLQLNNSETAIAQTLAKMSLPFKVLTRKWLLLTAARAPENISFPKENIHDTNRRPNPFHTLARDMIRAEALRDSKKINTTDLIPYFARVLDLTPSAEEIGSGVTSYLSKSNPDFQAISNLMIIKGKGEKGHSVLTIDGPAGSGKTQIGVQLATSAIMRGADAVIATHTNALANALALGLKAKKIKENLWQLSQPYEGTLYIGTIGKIITQVEYLDKSNKNYVDVVIVEESHVIRKEKIQQLLKFLDVGLVPHIYLLSDEGQYLFKEYEVGEIIYGLNKTYRLPIKINSFVNSLKARKKPFITLNPIDGEVVILDNFDSEEHASTEAIKVIQEIINNGIIKRNQIAVLLGSSVKRINLFKNKYDEFRTLDEDYTDHIVIDTVNRFQGFSRDMIFLIDFHPKDIEQFRGYFYLAATRSTNTFIAFISRTSGDKLKSIKDND